LIEGKGKDQQNAFEVKREWFKVDRTFAVGAVVVLAIFIVIYTIFW
jgi:SSS family solute:Na+ symporter